MLLKISGVVLTVLLAITVLLLSTIREPQSAALHARQGVLDLSAWDPEQDERIKLDGEWEFYWERLLPDESATSNQAGPTKAPDTYATVPGSWNRLKVDGDDCQLTASPRIDWCYVMHLLKEHWRSKK